MNLIQKLKEIDACQQATEWAEGKTEAEAWDTCNRADWMVFYLSATKKADLRTIVKLKVLIVDQVKDLVFDGDDDKLFEAAKAFANGELDSLDGLHIHHLYDCDCIFAAARAYAFNADIDEFDDRFDAFMLQSADLIRAEIPQI